MSDGPWYLLMQKVERSDLSDADKQRVLWLIDLYINGEQALVRGEQALVRAAGYLDDAIRRWRDVRDGEEPHTEEHQMALNYIDAFQSVRVSLYGELLP